MDEGHHSQQKPKRLKRTGPAVPPAPYNKSARPSRPTTPHPSDTTLPSTTGEQRVPLSITTTVTSPAEGTSANPLISPPTAEDPSSVWRLTSRTSPPLKLMTFSNNLTTLPMGSTTTGFSHLPQDVTYPEEGISMSSKTQAKKKQDTPTIDDLQTQINELTKQLTMSKIETRLAIENQQGSNRGQQRTSTRGTKRSEPTPALDIPFGEDPGDDPSSGEDNGGPRRHPHRRGQRNRSTRRDLGSGKLKLPAPTKFEGNIKKLNTFLREINTWFVLQPETFASDTAKIIWTLGYMGGDKIEDWVNNYTDTILDRDTTYQGYTEDIDAFIDLLKEYFGNHYKQEEAEAAIQKITQGGDTVNEYITRFESLKHQTLFDERALMIFFIRGLSHRMVQASDRYPPVLMYEGWVKLAKRIENDMTLRKGIMDVTGHSQAQHSTPKPIQTSRPPQFNPHKKFAPQNPGGQFVPQQQQPLQQRAFGPRPPQPQQQPRPQYIPQQVRPPGQIRLG